MSDNLYSHFFHSPLGHRLKIHQTFESVEQLRADKPIIIFRHGNGLSTLCYWPFLKYFLNDYELVLIDGQAHGLSDNGRVFAGWDKACDEIRPLLSAYQSQPLIAMGHSFGGILSLLSASRNPQLYQQVIALDPVLFPAWAANLLTVPGISHVWFRIHPLARQARRRRNGWGDRRQAYDYFYQRGIFKTWSDEALDAYLDHALIPADEKAKSDQNVQANHHGLVLACPPWMESRVFATYPKRLWSELNKLNTPTFYLHGDNTFSFLPASAAKLACSNRCIESQQIEGDHCFMLGQPRQAAEVILSHLQTKFSD